jgi:hypothetical protein
MNEFWMIVNIARATRDDYANKLISKSDSATHIHEQRSSADRELIRLTKYYPAGKFVIMKSEATCEVVRTPTYQIREISEVPF